MLLFYQWTVIKTSEWIGGEKGALWWPYTPSRTVMFFILWFWVLCFKWIKKSFVYSGYLEREMENISAHGPKKYTCQKKTQSATRTWFCFNKFTLSWEKQVLRKTTFVTFFCSWICLSNSKGFITLTAGAFPAERRGSMRIKGGQPLNSVFILLIIICWMTSLWPSFKLKFGHTRILLFSPSAEANLESPCLFRYVAYELSCLWHVWPKVWLRTSRVLIRRHNLCQSSRARLHLDSLSAEARRRLKAPPRVFSLIWLQQCWFSVCSSWRRRAVIMRVVGYCSCIGVLGEGLC